MLSQSLLVEDSTARAIVVPARGVITSRETLEVLWLSFNGTDAAVQKNARVDFYETDILELLPGNHLA